MKTGITVLLMLAGLACSPVALADETPDCNNIHDSLTQNWCWQADKDASEKALNQEYKAAKQRITDEYQSAPKEGEGMQQALLQAQRSWLKFREQQCKLEAYQTEEGSSANYSVTVLCMTEMNQARSTQLKKIPGL